MTDHQVELMYGKKNYSFPEFDDSSVSYDEFMEREHLGQYVGVSDDELTVDLWGTKNRKHYKRYVLTIGSLPYKKIKSYSLSLRPIELSVIEGLEGDVIVLYDTTSNGDANEKHMDADFVRYRYSLRTNDYKTLSSFSMKLSKQFGADVKRKIGKVLRKYKK